MGLIIKTLGVKAYSFSTEEIRYDFLIDSGALFSLVPAADLEKLGVVPRDTYDFFLADGAKVTRRVGDAYFQLEGRGAPAPVIFGERGDQPILGVTTLENCGLVLHPLKREIYPMSMIRL